ncbi:hypothetical protein [Curtobacterium sp. L1-20]|uniref:hypothetical protein n=1 Tax=Curtobacterium sp. L1-20 TaxID=3138181 RepID=UPI003B52C75B
MSKGTYDLRPLLHAQFLPADSSRGQRVWSVLLQVGAPLTAGAGMVLAVLRGLDVANGVGVALPAASLLVGAMFGAFVFLTNLRVKLAESATYAFRADLQRLVGAAAASCLYVAVVAIALAVMLALVGTFPSLRQPLMAPYVIGVLVAVGLHLGLNLIATVRRLFVIYLNMFAPDFNPPVGSPHVRTPHRTSSRGSAVGKR